METIYQSIEILSKEKGIDTQIVLDAVKDAMLIAARKHFRTEEDYVAELDEKTGVSQATLSSSYLLRAMVEQLGAVIALRTDGQGSSLEITVPHFSSGERSTAEAVRPAAGMLH